MNIYIQCIADDEQFFTICPTIQAEYRDHEVYYSVRHFPIFGIVGISTPVISAGLPTPRQTQT